MSSPLISLPTEVDEAEEQPINIIGYLPEVICFILWCFSSIKLDASQITTVLGINAFAGFFFEFVCRICFAASFSRLRLWSFPVTKERIYVGI